MKKNILFIVIGFVAGAIVVALLEFLLEFIFPHPEVDFNNREALTKMMSEMPVIAYILLALTHFLAIFVGGFVTGMRSESYPVRNALIVGGIFMVFTILSLIMIPHPAWFWVLGLGVILPAAYLGGKVGVNFNKG